MIGNMNNGYATGSEIIEGFYEAENMDACYEVESTKITSLGEKVCLFIRSIVVRIVSSSLK